MENKVRLIDANLFNGTVEFVQKHLVSGDSQFLQGYEAGLRGAVNAINELPTVDAVEVVHGRWVPVDHDGSWRVDMCSVCHRRMHYVDYDQPYQYCPNCGAKMDGS